MGKFSDDYCDVQPFFGNLSTVDALIAKAAETGIKVVLDIVPNHSSDRHPWFIDARSSRSSASRDGERVDGSLSLGPWEGAICSSVST